MTSHQWSAQIKGRAERAIADLETFYDLIGESTPFGRRQEVHRFATIGNAVITASGADTYVIQKLGSFEGICKQLSLLRPPPDFDEKQVHLRGLSLVSSVRAQMHSMGLVEHQSRQRS